MYEVLTFHLGHVTKVRFVFPPGGVFGELSPRQQADEKKPSFGSFVKKSHERWKGGRTFGGGEISFIDEAWFIYVVFF